MNIVVIGGTLPASGYYRAKARPGAGDAGRVPYTILRAMRFFEFLGRIADSNTNGDTVRLPAGAAEAQAADDVADGLVDIAVSPRVNGIAELAGRLASSTASS